MKQCWLCYMILCMAGSALAQTAPANEATEHAATLDAIRSFAQTYTKRLPNFTATQVLHRDVKPIRNGGTVFSRSALSPQDDVVEEQLSMVGGREVHKITKLNGKPVPADLADQPLGVFSRGEFGNLLGVLFDPATKASFEWDRMGKRDDRRVSEFKFQVPQKTGYGILEDGKTFRVPYRGKIFADPQTGEVLHVELNCTGIPGTSNYRQVDLAVDYEPTEVAGQPFLLPSHTRLYIRTRAGEMTSESDYKNYRRFASESSISFGDPDQ